MTSSARPPAPDGRGSAELRPDRATRPANPDSSPIERRASPCSNKHGYTVRRVLAMLIELNRLFAFDDLIAHYGGPRPLWEKLRPAVPVFSVQDGVALYLESQVDAFLKAVAEGVQLNRSAASDK